MAQDGDETDLNTNQIREWRSIVTLIVFVLTNVNVLFPYHIPIYVPRVLVSGILDALSGLRIISPRPARSHNVGPGAGKVSAFCRFRFPMNFLTAPLIADLFLLAILAIGRDEVYGGVIEANNIKPYDIMLFFISLAYIAISIDASGLIRWLAFKVLQKGGGAGHRLFLYLYTFFFVLGSFIGNDPIILSGTAFLAYMTRVSSNIVHPRAWITAQFAIANIASAILVSSNPTNLVLAGAFEIQFIHYTANMIVPVVATAIVLFPFLLYIIFNDERFVPSKINIHELPEEVRNKKPVNPNIPNARGRAEEEENQHANDEEGQLLSLEEIMNPFLDLGGAAFGAVIMAATLITLIVLNAQGKETPVFYVTLPAAVVMLVWDLSYGWIHRKETRRIAEEGRKDVEQLREEQAREARERQLHAGLADSAQNPHFDKGQTENLSLAKTPSPEDKISNDEKTPEPSRSNTEVDSEITEKTEQQPSKDTLRQRQGLFTGQAPEYQGAREETKSSETETVVDRSAGSEGKGNQNRSHRTLTMILAERYRWSQETFPTMTAVMSHLPFALIPFAFCMFTLVQALVTKGWIAVFAYGWDHWVAKTGTVGAIGGMGFLSVILCNFAGTNIGTTILLSRVIQAWVKINELRDTHITERTFWATVYSMAIGVNYGAFSTAFSASLAGLLWRDILARKHIRVKSLDFARVNLPIIAISMTVGCAVLVGEVYIMRPDTPYNP
ncbi:hypothetical protein PFICI_00137 [Pestalotiopsis fici W106-1]|uniref:Citrate transporter-like domain-containing protein n=1 Tax=Pestalotiopsis fici (strain W106-1 / CGMCC3.15140) TaxID=1229662 RepID=W3XJW0_PESFW|nr:uncharacterized protein PFICI_00137 [Pestalotiopsis fici W106-1]ETS86309.1 hypothetical protein PFICI_00137 [Pestalotiopsis fici W106-1]